jgi:hypothetical protein
MDGLDRKRCPARVLLEDGPWFYKLVTAYNAYEKGFLPEAGGMDDQPAKFPVLMQLMQNAVNTVMEIKAERDKGKGNRPGKSVLGRN